MRERIKKIFKEINPQLKEHQIIVATCTTIDASVIDTPLRPKRKTTHQITQDRTEEVAVKKEHASNVDKDGTWLNKRGKCHFGFKKHHVTDNKGLVLEALTTTASKNEIATLENA